MEHRKSRKESSGERNVRSGKMSSSSLPMASFNRESTSRHSSISSLQVPTRVRFEFFNPLVEVFDSMKPKRTVLISSTSSMM